MGAHVLMNVLDEQELRVAILRDGRLESVVHERMNDGQVVGNIYKARVANVEPSLDAAFIDLGTGKNGYLHVSELQQANDKSRIEKLLKPGQELVVQITKEAIRDKGPCVSTYISLPGRYLVLMSSVDKRAVSKRIADIATRRRLKNLLEELEAPSGFGYIVRTAGADRLDDEIRLDQAFLGRLWEEIQAQIDRVKAPACVYQEADVVVRTLRDVVDADVEQVIIDGEDLYDEARAFAQVFMPEMASRIILHREEHSLFAHYGVEDRLAVLTDRKVELPSGGNIVIEQTEALVSIDINSARSREGSDIEATALHTNLEAVQVIAEQLVLRDLGGIIIIDFIDMERTDSQRLVQLALRKALSTDKARTHIENISRFGLVEMTRQRRRPSHKILSSTDCPQCNGTGVIKTNETFEIECVRALTRACSESSPQRLEVVTQPDLAVAIMNGRRLEISQLEQRYDCKIVFMPDSQMRSRDFKWSVVQRKGRRRGGREDLQEPVRPGLVAPLLEDRARIAEQARQMARQKPADLMKEIAALRDDAPEQGREESGDQAVPVVAPAAAVTAVAPSATVPTVWQEAVELRALLFAAPSAVTINPLPSRNGSPLDSTRGGAKSPSPSGDRRRRRRRPSRAKS
jgi:ribonuclease E